MMRATGASKLPSDMTIYRIDRYSGSANPTGLPGRNTRAISPLSADAAPTVMHPKLNGRPWSSSYAVHRTEPRQVKRHRWNRRKQYV